MKLSELVDECTRAIADQRLLVLTLERSAPLRTERVRLFGRVGPLCESVALTNVGRVVAWWDPRKILRWLVQRGMVVLTC